MSDIELPGINEVREAIVVNMLRLHGIDKHATREIVDHAFAILADRAKRAQVVQKPVARVVQHDATVKLEWASVESAHNAKPGPLYSVPQPEQVAQVAQVAQDREDAA